MSRKLPIPPKEEIEAVYTTSISAVARHFKTSNAVVRNWMIHHGIERRSHAEACQITYGSVKPSREELVELYNIPMNITDIAKRCRATAATVRDWFKDYNIETRPLGEDIKRALTDHYSHIQFDKETVEAMYKKCGSRKLAAENLGISLSHMRQLLIRYDLI